MTRDLIVDNFAGGGGASTGIEMALGRSPDYAINHSDAALSMHAANHPETEHIQNDIHDVDPTQYMRRGDVSLAWFSPDCRHFSKASGAAKVDPQVRDLAWVVVRWIKSIRPEIIMLENVEEFMTWGPVCDKTNKPVQERAGETWDSWLSEIRSEGYEVEWRILRACDFGAPTIRKRLFLIARCDGRPIVWPEPTHGAPQDPRVVSGDLLPYRTAAEIIDWTIPVYSIFLTKEEAKEVGVKRPLAAATMNRIRAGVQRYVIDSKKPFIVTCNHAGDGFRGQGIHDPVNTLTAARDAHGLVSPSLVGVGGRMGQSPPRSTETPVQTLTSKADTAVVAPVIGWSQHGGGTRDPLDPIHTITASNKDQNTVIAGSMVQTGYGERHGQAPRALDLHSPLGTVVAQGGKHAAVAAHLGVMRNSGKPHSSAEDPTHTICANGARHHLVASFMAQQNTGVIGRPLQAPLSTVTVRATQQNLVASHMTSLKGSTRRDRSAEAPHSAITAQGGHAALTSAFLQTYYGNSNSGVDIFNPLPTVTTKDRTGLVTVEIGGIQYAIVDIGMRMLAARELFNAQGFDRSYQIETGSCGRRFTKTEQTKLVGNSVCPDLAAALVRANAPHLARSRVAA